MTTDHRENVMKLIEQVREERREIVSDIVERKGRWAIGQKEITRLRKQQELLTLLKAAGELFPRPRYLPERKKMTTDHRENVMKLIEHVREERREIVSDIVERKGRWAIGRYCCKSPKLPGANFSAVKKTDRRPPVDVASITLPRSPASLSSGDEVPHIFTRKSRVQPKEIFITSAKRLLQHNLPKRDYASPEAAGVADRKAEEHSDRTA
jgi:hypothetical protein